VHTVARRSIVSSLHGRRYHASVEAARCVAAFPRDADRGRRTTTPSWRRMTRPTACSTSPFEAKHERVRRGCPCASPTVCTMAGNDSWCTHLPHGPAHDFIPTTTPVQSSLNNSSMSLQINAAPLEQHEDVAVRVADTDLSSQTRRSDAFSGHERAPSPAERRPDDRWLRRSRATTWCFTMWTCTEPGRTVRLGDLQTMAPETIGTRARPSLRSGVAWHM
jgi:hypothetical protein